MLLVPVAIGIALLAPWMLGLFGPGYAKYGAPILMLLAAATVPRTLTEIYLGALRAQNRTSLVALVQGIRAVLILALTLVLTKVDGDRRGRRRRAGQPGGDGDRRCCPALIRVLAAGRAVRRAGRRGCCASCQAPVEVGQDAA